MKTDTFALVGANLIDGTGSLPIENSTILVKENIIQQIGRKEDIKLPQDCEVYDISGKTVMPGLIDMHVHLVLGQLDSPVDIVGFEIPSIFGRPVPWFGILAFAHARLCLEMGFTTVRDLGDIGYSSYATIAARDAVNCGMVEGPRIITAGQPLTTTGGHADQFKPLWLDRKEGTSPVTADGVDECLKAVRERVKMQADWIKIYATGGGYLPWSYQDFNDDELKVIVEEAHSKGKYVSAHVMHDRGGTAAINTGVDTIEHGTSLSKNTLELMLKKGTVLIPTLYAPWGIINNPDSGMTEAFKERGRKVLFNPHMESIRIAYNLGVKMAMGTDCGYPPCPHGTNAKELELMMEHIGISAMEAIVMSTKNAADALRMGDKIGTLAKDKLADIIVVNGNPLDDIKVLQEKENIQMVIKDGKILVKPIHPQH